MIQAGSGEETLMLPAFLFVKIVFILRLRRGWLEEADHSSIKGCLFCAADGNLLSDIEKEVEESLGKVRAGRRAICSIYGHHPNGRR